MILCVTSESPFCFQVVIIGCFPLPPTRTWHSLVYVTRQVTYVKFSSTMGYSQHFVKRSSSCQRRKKKKAKDGLNKSMARSIMKIVTHVDNDFGQAVILTKKIHCIRTI